MYVVGVLRLMIAMRVLRMAGSPRTGAATPWLRCLG